MSKYDLIIESSHPHVAKLIRNWLYSDLAMSPINLANAAFKVSDPEIVREQMERARESLQATPSLAFRSDKLTKAWKMGILVYDTRAKFYREQGIEIEPLMIDGKDRIERYPFRSRKITFQEELEEFIKTAYS